MIKISALVIFLFATLLMGGSIYASESLDYKGRALLHLGHVYAYKNNGARYPEERNACRHYFQQVYGADQLDELVSYDINLSNMRMRADAVIGYMNYKLEPLGTWPNIGFLNQTKTPNAPAVYFYITVDSRNNLISGSFVRDNGNYQCRLST